MKSVYGAVRTGSLNKAVCASYLKGYSHVLYLYEKNSDLCHLQHKLIGFYNLGIVIFYNFLLLR